MRVLHWLVGGGFPVGYNRCLLLLALIHSFCQVQNLHCVMDVSIRLCGYNGTNLAAKRRAAQQGILTRQGGIIRCGSPHHPEGDSPFSVLFHCSCGAPFQTGVMSPSSLLIFLSNTFWLIFLASASKVCPFCLPHTHKVLSNVPQAFG